MSQKIDTKYKNMKKNMMLQPIRASKHENGEDAGVVRQSPPGDSRKDGTGIEEEYNKMNFNNKRSGKTYIHINIYNI